MKSELGVHENKDGDDDSPTSFGGKKNDTDALVAQLLAGPVNHATPKSSPHGPVAPRKSAVERSKEFTRVNSRLEVEIKFTPIYSLAR
jgi:hypothetical protein